jgi:hypothetical protein
LDAAPISKVSGGTSLGRWPASAPQPGDSRVVRVFNLLTLAVRIYVSCTNVCGGSSFDIAGGDVIQDATSIISTVAIVVGLAFAGVQLRLLLRQLRDGQAVSRAAELRAVNSMDTKLQYLIEEPELRDYFLLE